MSVAVLIQLIRFYFVHVFLSVN